MPIGPSPTVALAVLFSLHIPSDVSTTQETGQVTAAHSAQLTAGSRNKQESSLTPALHKTCENIRSIKTLSTTTNLAENGHCI